MSPKPPKRARIGVVNVYGMGREVTVKLAEGMTGSQAVARACEKASNRWGGEWRWAGVIHAA